MALVVKSAIKSHVSKSKMRVSGDFWKALDGAVADMLKCAVSRAKDNGRKTLRAADL